MLTRCSAVAQRSDYWAVRKNGCSEAAQMNRYSAAVPTNDCWRVVVAQTTDYLAVAVQTTDCSVVVAAQTTGCSVAAAAQTTDCSVAAVAQTTGCSVAVVEVRLNDSRT